jgi:hypothetical protein
MVTPKLPLSFAILLSIECSIADYTGKSYLNNKKIVSSMISKSAKESCSTIMQWRFLEIEKINDSNMIKLEKN